MIGPAISTLGFLVKEIAIVLRQPRLILSLVLGPFLILLLFGLGYRGPHPEFRTILVIPSDPAIAEKVDVTAVYREGLSGVFKLSRIMSSETEALAEVRAGRADVVVVVPPDLFQQVYAGRQAVLKVLYTETDPTSNAWVRYFTSVQTGELNRRILVQFLRQAKGPAQQMLDYADRALGEVDAIQANLATRDRGGALDHSNRLLISTNEALEEAAEDVDALSNTFGETATEPNQARRLLLETGRDLEELRADLVAPNLDPVEASQRIRRVRANLDELRAVAERVNSLPVELLVSPLTAEPQNVAPVEPTPVAFYTPAVLVLLLQHIGVTLSSLSAVRDRLIGSLEFVRVSPAGSWDVLIGKSLGFGLLLAVVGTALTAALTQFLDLPLLGSPVAYWLAVGVVIFASVGLGFALAVLAATESQAVQLSMLVLLTSVFFGGFFLPTNLLFAWVRSISFALPVTYGAINLRDLMLRGSDPSWQMMLAPLALGLAFYVVAYLGLRREMHRG